MASFIKASAVGMGCCTMPQGHAMRAAGQRIRRRGRGATCLKTERWVSSQLVGREEMRGEHRKK